jgi:hypothetical protein
MKALLEAVTWILLNIMGGWLIATNLLEVGRLGVAAVGFLILIVAWGWLVATIVAGLRRRVVLRRSER